MVRFPLLAGWATIVATVILLTVTNRAAARSSVLYLIPDARSNALGISGAADASDPGTVWHNPANAALLHGVYAIVFTGKITDWSEGQSLGGQLTGGGEMYRRGRLALGLGGELRHTDQTGGGSYTSTTLAVDLLAWDILHVSVGGTYKRVSPDSPPWYTGPINTENVYDLGARLGVDKTFASQWRLDAAVALSARNEGDLYYYGFGEPRTTHTTGTTLGLSSPPRDKMGASAFSFRANFDYIEPQLSQAANDHAIGLETGFFGLAFFRVGWRLDKVLAGLGLGAKTGHVRYRLDLAIVPLTSTDGNRYKTKNTLSLLVGWEW